MYLTLNIGSREIRFLAVDSEGIQHWERKELPSGWVKDGSIMEPKGVGAVIVSLLEPYKTKKGSVAVCVSGLPFTYRIANFPRMKPSMLRESIRHFMMKETSMPMEQMYLSWAVMDESDDEAKLLILGVDQNIIDTIAATMKEARVKYWSLDLKAVALARAASQENCIVVSAEHDGYDIIIVDEGNISTIHTVSTEMMQTYQEHCKQILIETSKAITYDAKKRGRAPEKNIPLIITGELASNEGFGEMIQGELGYDAEPLAAPLTLPPDFPTHLYSTNIGLALRENEAKIGLPVTADGRYVDVNMDIMQGVYAPQPKHISSAVVVIPVIISFGICAALPVYLAHAEHVKNELLLQNELALVNHQIEQARLRQEKAIEIQRETDRLYAQIDDVEAGHQALFGDQGKMAKDLKNIVSDLPGYDYLTNLSYQPEQITVSGRADSPYQAIEYTKALEEEPAFPDVRLQKLGKGAGGDTATEDEDEDNTTTEDEDEDNTAIEDEDEGNATLKPVTFDIIINK